MIPNIFFSQHSIVCVSFMWYICLHFVWLLDVLYLYSLHLLPLSWHIPNYKWILMAFKESLWDSSPIVKCLEDFGYCHCFPPRPPEVKLISFWIWKLNFECHSSLQMTRQLWLGWLRTVVFRILNPLSFLYPILCAAPGWGIFGRTGLFTFCFH